MGRRLHGAIRPHLHRFQAQIGKVPQVFCLLVEEVPSSLSFAVESLPLAVASSPMDPLMNKEGRGVEWVS